MKSEIRNLKSEASPKAEIRNRFNGGLMLHWVSGFGLRISGFGFSIAHV